jgi:hypothetical protein
MSDSAAVPDTKRPRGKSRWHWLLWWQIDQAELARQVAEYDGLGFLASARKLSVLLLMLSSVANLILIAAGISDKWTYLDITLFTSLAIFIFFGHRWAMISAMVLWTIEKGDSIYDITQSSAPNGVSLVPVIFWAVFMHAFYLAFRVETQRSRPEQPASE